MQHFSFALSGLCLAASLCCPMPALAHDFWLQPSAFRAEAGAVVPATLQVGHGAARQRSPIPAERITALRSISTGGTADQRAGLRLGAAEEDLELTFQATGTQVVALETNYALSNLPAIRFNDYLKAEGLTRAIEHRQSTGTADEPGRELYCRRAKSLVQVGPSSAGQDVAVTTAVGLTLEIVPEKNPYGMVAGEPLPVRVIYLGQPLAGALVKLTDLDADERPVETHLTDSSGRASFTVPRRGSWLLNVIWTEPVAANAAADYVTTFSSLSFGDPEIAP